MRYTFLSTLSIILAFATIGYAQEDREGIFAGQLMAQVKLKKLGYDVGKPDGKIGPKTLAAVKKDAEKHGYEPTISGFQDFYIERVIKGSKSVESEEVKDKAKKAIGDTLLDPYTAIYEDWRYLPSGAICVDVNAKNAYGAYAGKQPKYVQPLFGTVIPPSTNQNLNFWQCYLDPEGY